MSTANCTMWATHTLAVRAQQGDGVSTANCTMWATHTLAVRAQTRRRCEYSELYNVGYTHSSCTCTKRRCEYSELYNVGYTHSSCTCTNKETV